MNFIIYIILGIIQGFTEPLPISSSGHIFLFKNIFNTKMFNDLNFEIVANFGSFIAILFIFRKEVWELVRGFFKYLFNKKEDCKGYFKYTICLIISTIPVGIIGLILKDVIEDKLTNIKFLGWAFLITGIFLMLIKNKNGNKEDKDITYVDAFIVGLLEIFTIMPGISRSGMVLVACLLVGMKRKTALKYTFMLYFPISVATMGLGVKDLILMGNFNQLVIPYSLGMISALIVTYLTYKWLSQIVQNGKLWKFSIYCWLVAMFVFFYFR